MKSHIPERSYLPSWENCGLIEYEMGFHVFCFPLFPYHSSPSLYVCLLTQHRIDVTNLNYKGIDRVYNCLDEGDVLHLEKKIARISMGNSFTRVSKT